MTKPDPKPPSEGGLPSRHRPVLGELAKDTMEMGLWALDEEPMTLEEDVAPAPRVAPAPIRLESQVPSRREVPAAKSRKERPGDSQAEAAPDGASSPPAVKIQMNVGKIPVVRRGQGQTGGQSRPEADFADLDQWDDDASGEDSLELSELEEDPAEPIPAPALEPPPEMPPPAVDTVMPVDPPTPEPETDEFSPRVRPSADPVSLRPHLRLSKFERVGIAALGIVLLGLGVGAYVFTLNRLPSQSLYTDEVDFPVKGALVAVDGATSYWRAPVPDGPSPDVVRRGTVVIPVVEVTTSSGSGALRAVFRDENRKTIGDSITRQFSGAGVVRIASTAGFEDTGTHAAYRAGGGSPWTVEILEGPSADSPSTDFKKLFQINLSTATR